MVSSLYYYLSFTSILFVELVLNNTIEERVTLLEIQVTDMREDITEIDEDVTLVVEDVSFLFDETVIQDERLFSLEQDNDVINQDLEGQFLQLNRTKLTTTRMRFLL